MISAHTAHARCSPLVCSKWRLADNPYPQEKNSRERGQIRNAKQDEDLALGGRDPRSRRKPPRARAVHHHLDGPNEAAQKGEGHAVLAVQVILLALLRAQELAKAEVLSDLNCKKEEETETMGKS